MLQHRRILETSWEEKEGPPIAGFHAYEMTKPTRRDREAGFPGKIIFELSTTPSSCFQTSLVAEMVKSLLAMQEIQERQVQSLGWEDPLEKEKQPPPVFLPGELHGQKSLVGYSPWGLKESDMTEQLSLSLFQGKCS